MNQGMSDYARWCDAETTGTDDEADRAFRAVFQTFATDQPLSADFAARTMAAVGAAADRDARRARRTRVAIVSGTIAGASAAAYFGTGWAIALLTSAFIGFVNLVVAAIVRGAAGVDGGLGFWGVLGSLGRAASAFAADPKVSFGVLAIQVVAMAALIALRRLLGSDVESFE